MEMKAFPSRSELPANTVANVEKPVPSSSQGGGHHNSSQGGGHHSSSQGGGGHHLYPALHEGRAHAQPRLVGRQDKMSGNMKVEVDSHRERDEEKCGDLPILKCKGEKLSQNQSGKKEVEKIKREEEELLERL